MWRVVGGVVMCGAVMCGVVMWWCVCSGDVVMCGV